MKKIIVPILILCALASCKKDLNQKQTEAEIPAGAGDYRQFDTTHYYDGNITAHQFQEQSINLVKQSDGSYTALFTHLSLKFTNIASPTDWITGQSAGTFNVTYNQTPPSNCTLSASAPRFSETAYVTGYTTWGEIDIAGITVVQPGTHGDAVYTTIPGVLIMSSYSPSKYAIMPGAYHTRDGIVWSRH